MNNHIHIEGTDNKSSVPSLLILSAAAGTVAALIAVAYRYVLGLADNGRSFLLSFVTSPIRIVIMFAALIAIGLFVGWITQSEPMIKGSGIPQVEGQVRGHFTPKWLPVLIKKFVAGALAVFCGLSLGREGPSIQLGAMAAQGIAETTHRRFPDSRFIIICGACAGLSAAFNAPLAGILFALEEIHKSFSYRSVFSAMVAALFADIVSSIFYGVGATLQFPIVSTIPLKYYLLYISIGIICGAFGVLYNRTVAVVQGIYKKIPLPDMFRIAIPFVFAGIAALTLPQILSGGHLLLNSLTFGNMALGLMILLFVAKFIFSMICFGSGAPGGIFFPLLVLGAFLGSIIGRLSINLFGVEEFYMVNFMLLGMAATFAGIVRAPLTGIVLVAEMSGSLTQFIGLAIVSCTACLIASLLGGKPIYDQLLEAMLPKKNHPR